VAAVLANWNLPDYTVRCVRSLRASDYPDLRIIVVDNGSRQELYARLRSELTDAELIRSEVNRGFAAGNNLGIRRALEDGADYVLVINNDTVVDSRMLGRLVEAAEARPDAGLIGPMIYHLDRRDEVWWPAYHSVEAQGIVRYVLCRGLPRRREPRAVQDVDFVGGCGVLIPRGVLLEVGMFSETYFMYYEDFDLCVRVRRSGRAVVCVTNASMWHAVSASYGGRDSLRKRWYQVRSALTFYGDHSRGLRRTVSLAFVLMRTALLLGRSLVRGTIAALAGGTRKVGPGLPR
jgi:hypothetical protein